MAEPVFQNADDVCKIVAACRKAGVFRFTNGPLVIEFVASGFSRPESFPTRRQAPPGASPTSEAQAPEETIRAEQSRIAELSFEEQELDAKERRIAELIIEDPYLAEQMMSQGELEIADGEPDGLGSDSIDDE